jgi:Phage integrase family
MATGLRIGEACGLTWSAVDLDAGTIDVRAAVVRVKGQGLVVKKTKTDTGARTLVLPRWCVTMLRDRATHGQPLEEGDPAFPAPLGGWREPSDTQADLRDAFATAGFDWVTSHVFRETVATLTDQARLSSRVGDGRTGELRHGAPRFEDSGGAGGRKLRRSRRQWSSRRWRGRAGRPPRLGRIVRSASAMGIRGASQTRMTV